MYKIKNKLYAKGFCYLKRKSDGAVALSTEGVPDDWTEVEMERPLKPETDGELVTWQGGLLAQNISGCKTYDEVKLRIISSRYSTDDQIAIILNAGNGDEESKFAYDCMQEWRNFASELAEIAMEKINQTETK